MTETQTFCAACGDTGFVPPFMDPCTAAGCTAGFNARVDTTADAIAAALVVEGTIHPTTDGYKVYVDGAWQPLPTETLSAGEYAAKYKPVVAADVVEATIAAAEVAAAADEVDATGYTRKPSIWSDPLGDATEHTPKTSRDTFADLVAACESIPDPEPVGSDGTYYGEAGIYSDPSISYGGSTKTTGKPMTEAQEKLLRKLLAERDPDSNPIIALAQERLDTGTLTAKSASGFIDKLLKVPANPAKSVRPNKYAGTCTACGGTVEAGAGRIEKTASGRWTTSHLVDGCLTPGEVAALEADKVTEPGLYKAGHPIGAAGTEIYRVRKSRTSDRLYGELITTRHDGTVGFVYNANAMTFLRKADKLTWQEAREFGVAYGACIACGRTLSDSRSLVQGYGPTCATHNGWATVSQKQAEAIVAGDMTWEEATGLSV